MTNSQHSAPIWLKWATVILGLLGLIYIGGGFHDLLSEADFRNALDLRLRWTEQSYVRIGVDPYDISAHPENADPVIGPIPFKDPGGYPPWAFLTQEVLLPPIPFYTVRIYFVLLNVIAYTVIGKWAYEAGRSVGGKTACWFMVAMCVACAANAILLRWGNYTAIVLALLIGMAYFARTGHPLLAGICLGLAMIKPQDAMLFIFVLTARTRWSAAAVAVAYTIVAALLTSWRVGTSPFHLADQMFQGAMSWANLHLGILEPLLALKLVPTGILTQLGLAMGIVAAAVLTWRYRARSDYVLMAIAAVVAIISTYHRRFDSLMLVLLLVPLAIRALRSNSPQMWAAFVANGLFLWLPLRELDYFNVVVSTSHCIVAIWGLSLVIRYPLSEITSDTEHGSAASLLLNA